MSDDRAESLPESELRVVLVCGGFKPTPQYRIVRAGREVARLDHVLQESKTAVEYDGLWHRTKRQLRRDKLRRKWLSAEGWRFVIITAEKLAGDHERLLAEVREAHFRNR